MKIDAIKLRKLRLKAGFRYQSRVAEILGITRNAVCQWERGQSCPQRKTLHTLASLYKCNIADFCDHESSTESPYESHESLPESVYESLKIDIPSYKLPNYVQNIVKARDDALNLVQTLNKQLDMHYNHAA